ncbi:shootin-1-like [Coccinella septempunctata]|uniref:shootin-1-like n=1 Tax=Coccinella septempunctata TaxID=41139 RepID=UPI001D0875EE|nr:shootin-1-like [Coccinella septempunctata]
MARIRKVTKTNRGVNACNEELAERRLDRNLVDVNLLNSRKLCNNDRNRRILLTLKSYPNLFQSYYFSNNFLPTMRKYSISTSTQTSQNGGYNQETSTVSTQTHVRMQQSEKFNINIKSSRRSKSDSSLLKNFSQKEKNRTNKLNSAEDNETLKNLVNEYKEKINKKIIFLHRNENIGKPQTLKSKVALKKEGNRLMQHKRINKRTRMKLKSRVYTRTKPKRQSYIHEMNRKLTEKGKLEKNEDCRASYHKFIDKVQKYSWTTISEWSSKLLTIFSDLGISLTKSVTNLYNYYEYQGCTPSDTLCYCRDFHHKIDHLIWKMNQLENNLYISQAKLNEQQRKIENAESLEIQIEQMRRKLESYDSLKAELADLKKRLNGSSAAGAPPTPPLPPPPPPLPVFSLTTNCASKTFLRVEQNDRKLINYENPRPIITLQDILNVKLKKISVTNV